VSLRDQLEHYLVHVLLGRPRGGGHIKYIPEGLRYRTAGLRAALSHPEIEVEVGDDRLLPEANRFLVFVTEYLDQKTARITANETMSYGTWIVKFVGTKRQSLEAWAAVEDDSSRFKPNADLAMRLALEQRELAARLKTGLSVPYGSDLYAFDDGEGRPVELYRDVPTPGHSGWFILSDRFTGNFELIRNQHLYHLVGRHGELVKYLGLRPGWHVDLREGERVWFEDLAQQ